MRTLCWWIWVALLGTSLPSGLAARRAVERRLERNRSLRAALGALDAELSQRLAVGAERKRRLDAFTPPAPLDRRQLYRSLSLLDDAQARVEVVWTCNLQTVHLSCPPRDLPPPSWEWLTLRVPEPAELVPFLESCDRSLPFAIDRLVFMRREGDLWVELRFRSPAGYFADDCCAAGERR